MFKTRTLVRTLATFILCAGLIPASARARILADADADGVDDAVDCRPVDATTWSAPSEAMALALAGAASTGFHWTAPASPGGTAILYDVIRATTPFGFGSGSCVDSNDAATTPAVTDSAIPAPGTAFFYLVRSKTACGGALGIDSHNVQRTGVSCSTSAGGGCAVGASCEGGWCCGSACADVANDANNCGACGQACLQVGGTNACIGGGCFPTCNPGWCDLDFNPNDGCEPAIDVTNCGACGNVCPGYNQPADNVACGVSQTCTFSCQGEHYDVDHDPSDGCEVVDTTTGNHTQGTAASQGSKSCNDGDTFSFGGKMIDDSSVHENPAVTGFDATTGSAPDWMSLAATGGFTCIDDLSVTLQVTGSATPTCYNLAVITNQGTFSCQTSSSGTCLVSRGSGSYNDNTTIYFKVTRTCSPSTSRESVSYTVSGHL